MKLPWPWEGKFLITQVRQVEGSNPMGHWALCFSSPVTLS